MEYTDTARSRGFCDHVYGAAVVAGKYANLFLQSRAGIYLFKLKRWLISLLSDVQVRDAAINSLVEIYRHVGERVRADLSKKGLPQSR